MWVQLELYRTGKLFYTSDNIFTVTIRHFFNEVTRQHIFQDKMSQLFCLYHSSFMKCWDYTSAIRSLTSAYCGAATSGRRPRHFSNHLLQLFRGIPSPTQEHNLSLNASSLNHCLVMVEVFACSHDPNSYVVGDSCPRWGLQRQVGSGGKAKSDSKKYEGEKSRSVVSLV